MSAQTTPAAPIYAVTSAATAGNGNGSLEAYLQQIVADLVALRNTVDAMVTVFNAHTHKTPTSNPGATSTPTSDAGGSGSSGGTASIQTTAANIVAAV